MKKQFPACSSLNLLHISCFSPQNHVAKEPELAADGDDLYKSWSCNIFAIQYDNECMLQSNSSGELFIFMEKA